METLIGVIIDVSNCMEESSLKISNIKNSDWINSIFRVVNELVQHDVSPSNYIFALGFGAKNEPCAFDILNTIKQHYCPSDTGTKREKLESILDILESCGAPKLDRSAYIDDLEKAVEETDASLFLEKLRVDEEFKVTFYNKLPPYLRGSITSMIPFYSNISKMLEYLAKQWSPERQAAERKNAISNFVAMARELIMNSPLVNIGQAAVLDVHIAAKILKACLGDNFLTKQRIEELSKDAMPYILGSSPLNTALASAFKLFSNSNFKDLEKLLIIISAGKPSDASGPQLSEGLSKLGVKTVCCYVTKTNILNPRQLYSTIQPAWDDSAKLMFNISSIIPTQKIPCTVFLNRGWTVELQNNETRLFVQVNNPDVIEDACNFAREMAFSQEVLSGVLSSVSLDLYINKANTNFTPQTQEGGTCYANAAATVMHLSMKRIFNRTGGWPDFFSLRDEIINEYGTIGASTLDVLKTVCPRYRLQCQKVDVREARKAIVLKRPVVALYYLTDPEWKIFSDFFGINPKGVLSASVLDLYKPGKRQNLKGHAVVLTSFNSNGLRLMNSWGSDWADGGFFMISNAKVLNLKFIDVFWTLPDLEESEIEGLNRYGPVVASELISRLKLLHDELYTCPVCIDKSKIGEFTGHHLKPICPICRHKFKADKAHDSLALHMYLLSVSRSGNYNVSLNMLL